MTNEQRIEEMLADGFTQRMAEEYLNALETEKSSGMFDPEYLAWAHDNGFYAESAYAYGLTPENVSEYLSDYDDMRMWPLNSWQRIWINDKLTLNAMLLGTDMQKYLPEYYYYSTQRGLLPLQDSNGKPTLDALMEKLREKGELACKPCNGALACGFHKAEYIAGSYILDGRDITEQEMASQLNSMRNYVFTEFIRPSDQIAQINPRIHTIRVIWINKDGVSPRPVAAYVRFATTGDEEGFKPNYQPPTKEDIFSYNAQIDLETGHLFNGKIVYANKVIDAPEHPASGTLVDMTIDCWDEALDMMYKLSMKFNACEYLGFDACITDKGPRIMEINSSSGIKYIQLYTPLMTDDIAAPYFQERMDEIAAMSPEEIKKRNRIAR